MSELLTKELYVQRLQESVITQEPLLILRKTDNTVNLVAVKPRVETKVDGTKVISPVIVATTNLSKDQCQKIEESSLLKLAEHAPSAPLLFDEKDSGVITANIPEKRNVQENGQEPVITQAGGGFGSLLILALLFGGAIIALPSEKAVAPGRETKKEKTLAGTKNEPAQKRGTSRGQKRKNQNKAKTSGPSRSTKKNNIGHMPVIEL